MTTRFYDRVRALVFWITLICTYVAAILPQTKAPSLGYSDKTDHIMAFLTLTLLGRAAYWQRPAWRLAAGLALFGAFIEVSQAVPFLGRDASLLDWVADTLAIVVGCGLAIGLNRFFPVLFSNPRENS